MSGSLRRSGSAILVSVFLSAASAVRAQHAAVPPTFVLHPASLPVVGAGDPALSPMPFVLFCMTYRSECLASPGGASTILTEARRRALSEINHAVNHRIVPQARASGTPWSLTATTGDCNDFAVQKRHELLAQGWPSSSLLLAVVRIPSGTAHLVLVARTDRGDFVLDNLSERVLSSAANGYRWIKMQTAENPNRWVEVAQQPAPMTARKAGPRTAAAI